MSTRKKPSNSPIQRLFRTIWRLCNATTKAFISWLLRTMLLVQRRSRLNQAGFVLPTIVMVVLVVILLTTAIFIRSFDRSRNASNYRVSETVLNAAAPALDRARAKLYNLFSPEETGLKGNTPSETSVAQVFEQPKYTFGDETPLKIVYDSNNNGTVDPEDTNTRVSPEKLKTAWKFPVDTDNNGKFDSFTIYGIYYRIPDSNRARSPLEARARPQRTGIPDDCTAGNGGGDPGGGPNNGWEDVGDGQLKRAFFTYVATVPITQQPTAPYKGTIAVNKFETYKGNKGFSALEMQQDQARLALDNNAVWYEDDLIITDVPEPNNGFKLNGRIQVNGNLMVGSSDSPFTGNITFYQVSSPWSCFYNAENSKIIVGGNVVANGIAGTQNTANLTNNKVNVHLYKQPRQLYNVNNNSRVVNDTNVTTTDLPRDVAYNTRAYAQRLKALVDGGMSEYDAVNPNQPPNLNNIRNVTRFPQELIEKFEEKYPNAKTPSPDEARNILEQAVEVYFKERIRRVPYAEVPIDQPRLALQVGGAQVSGNRSAGNYIFSGGGPIAAPERWMRIGDPTTQAPNGYTNVELKFTGNTMELEQSKPTGTLNALEDNIGDRVLVGNGLPNIWLKEDGTYAEPGEPQPVKNAGAPVAWTGDPEDRTRLGRAKVLEDLGDTSRNGFWEKAAADPENIPDDEELAGGLRIITGAGIYADNQVPPLGTGKRVIPNLSQPIINPLGRPASFLPDPQNSVTVDQLKRINGEINPTPLKPVSIVWPDLMPMYLWKDRPIGGVPGTAEPQEVLKGDLQMRTTVVYHYLNGDNPIACISSYYDPTNADTAQNSSAVDPTNGDPRGASNNGLNYNAANLVGQRGNITRRLRKQAYMVFPDGRWANAPLKNAVEALQRVADPTQLSLEQKAALDAANCALNILDGASPTPGATVPDGAIREKAFLDARQVKTLHKPDVEFNVDGITFAANNPLIDRQTVLADAGGKVLIADPEQLKIATQATLESPPLTKTFKPTPAEYSLPIEQRQPLEIRVTEIDLNQLRRTRYRTTPTGAPEYLLPNSGIIYASRDDALPDITDVNLKLRRPRDGGGSATDYKVDPSRRPNGIRLINGANLSRDPSNEDRPEERGLILASNLPVYIQGDFNLHRVFNGTDATEEFEDTLEANYNDFYQRRQPRDRNFACRRGSKPGCNPGDQWRAARILSDAITLLSGDFRDGFRNESDYDLNNNGGNLLVASRLKNGFWWNGFAPNYVYKDNTGNPLADQYPINADFDPDPGTTGQGSSYAMNGVTPIQRRVRFREYLMEACAKLPISECSPQDWFVGGLNSNNLNSASDIIGQNLPANNSSGTTAQSPVGIFQSSARRVAFKRNEFGQLVLPNSCTANAGPNSLVDCDAIPLGIDNTSRVREYAYKHTDNPTPSVPREANNALWYWTTNDTSNAEPSTATPSYDKDNLLYYLPDDPETVPTERQLLLPGTPKFPPDLETLNAAFAGQSLLNGNAPSDPSDFAVCIAGTGSKDYETNLSSRPDNCSAAQAKIEQMRSALLGLTGNISNVLQVTTPWNPATPAVASAKVNVFELSNNQIEAPTTPTITLDRGNQSDPIFVIRSSLFRPIAFKDVQLRLNGVDPNNVFWVTRSGIQIRGATKLAGNFIGGAGRFQVVAGSTVELKGARLLGFNRGATGTPTMTAMTTTAQPLLVPVLQLHSPKGVPSNNRNTAFESDSRDTPNLRWLQRAQQNTNYNASLIMGDTPARPYTTGGGENNGGLHNFPRFLENWVGRTATIKGSLIQYIKSKYATGPFDAVDLVNQPEADNSLFFDGPVPDYISGSNPDLGSNPADPQGYQYTEAAARNKAPFYQPPTRNWGYDVGLLSQTPDLFSRRFAIPSAGTPNEFYREASGDDPWVQGLLCAAEQNNAGTYQWTIRDPAQRPNSCRTGNPGAEYNDPPSS